MCGENIERKQRTVATFIKADGSSHYVHLCISCAQKMSCKKHRTLHVIFIDNRHACAECVESEAKAIFARKPDKVAKDYNEVKQLAGDLDEFLRLVRAATLVPDLSEELCWLCGVFAKAKSFGIKPSQVIKDVKKKIKNNKSMVDSLLPQSLVK